jgi:hypothetical protein
VPFRSTLLCKCEGESKVIAALAVVGVKASPNVAESDVSGAVAVEEASEVGNNWDARRATRLGPCVRSVTRNREFVSGRAADRKERGKDVTMPNHSPLRPLHPSPAH